MDIFIEYVTRALSFSGGYCICRFTDKVVYFNKRTMEWNNLTVRAAPFPTRGEATQEALAYGFSSSREKKPLRKRKLLDK
jgi:hypothetical protein